MSNLREIALLLRENNTLLHRIADSLDRLHEEAQSGVQAAGKRGGGLVGVRPDRYAFVFDPNADLPFVFDFETGRTFTLREGADALDRLHRAPPPSTPQAG